jgi:hypothetical protein
VPGKKTKGGSVIMKKEVAVQEWIKKTQEELEKEKREIDLDYYFRLEFGFSPEKIEWREGPVAVAIATEDRVTFAATEIFSKKKSDWKFWDFSNCFYWEKQDGKYLYSVSISKDRGIELYD